MDNFKFGSGDLAKERKILNLKHYTGPWDGKWECDLSSTIVMWIK